MYQLGKKIDLITLESTLESLIRKKIKLFLFVLFTKQSQA